MTIDDVRSFLSAYNPDHYPKITIATGTNWNQHFYFDDDYYHISIVKFPPEYYSGDWECFSPGLFEDVYRFPTLTGILDFLLSAHPALLYSKANHPELFI